MIEWSGIDDQLTFFQVGDACVPVLVTTMLGKHRQSANRMYSLYYFHMRSFLDFLSLNEYAQITDVIDG